MANPSISGIVGFHAVEIILTPRRKKNIHKVRSVAPIKAVYVRWMHMMTAILMSILSGFLCTLIAAGKGRSILVWFVIGFFFSLFALVIIICLPDLHAENAARTARQMEVSDLRELLKQERMKNEELQRLVAQQPDAHDGK